MAKFYGKIGYIQTVESEPGYWEEKAIEREYYGDITRNSSRYQQDGHINENIVINRITGDPVKEDLIAPTWLLKKFCVLNDIDKEMVKRDTYQGKYAKNPRD